MNNKEAYGIIDDYNNRPHVRGDVDCNLLFLKIHEPEKFEEFHNRYKTIIGGVRVSRKIFGVSSIKEYLDTCGDYEIVRPNFQRPLDVIVFKDQHDLFVSLGNKWFGVDDSDTFSIVQKSRYNPENYTIYRKVI